MCPSLTSAETTQSFSNRPSEQFRNELLVVRKHLSHIEDWTHELDLVPPVEKQKRLANIVRVLNDQIKTHLEWTKKKLYPAVDKRVSNGGKAFSSSMLYENHIIERWIDELDIEFSQKIPNVEKFEHRSYQLLGLLKAHLEEEEEVLLTILDRSMTPSEFMEELFPGPEQI